MKVDSGGLRLNRAIEVITDGASREIAMTAEALIRKLSRRDHLSRSEKLILEKLPGPTKFVKAGAVIVAPHDRPTSSTLLISGMCARYTILARGARTLTELTIAGDFVDLHSLLMKQMDHGIVALADCAIARVPHERLCKITEQHPHLTRLLWLETVIDAAIQRQWLVTLGRQKALNRMAHFICELYARSEAAGVARDDTFEARLTQSDLADLLGLTPVHVNRTLKELRRRNLVEWRGAKAVIYDWQGLAELGEFDPVYLRLQRAAV